MAEKYKYCPRCSQPLEDDGSCPGCTYGHKREVKPAKTVNTECPWNDHGIRCNKPGSMSDSTNGSGPWYCPEHYWRLKGRVVKDDRHHGPGPARCSYPGCEAEGIAGKNPYFCLTHYGYSPTPSHREQWYASRGLPYQPPKSGLKVALPKRQREPGDDDEEVAG